MDCSKFNRNGQRILWIYHCRDMKNNHWEKFHQQFWRCLTFNQWFGIRTNFRKLGEALWFWIENSLRRRRLESAMEPTGQIIATSHDLTPNGGSVMEIPLFQGNLGWWNIIIWPEPTGVCRVVVWDFRILHQHLTDSGGSFRKVGIPSLKLTVRNNWLVATQILFIFTPKIGGMIQFDEYFSKGLKPPTRQKMMVSNSISQFSRGLFSGAMLVSGRVIEKKNTVGLNKTQGSIRKSHVFFLMFCNHFGKILCKERRRLLW